MNVAQGSYIQWLDADDLLDPRKITIQMEKANLIDSKMVLFTASFGSFYYRKDKAVFRPNTLWQDLSPIDWVLNKFNDNVWLNPTSWLVSRELTEMAGPWNEYIAKSGDDDGEYICRIIKNCEKVRFVHEAKCYYRIGNLGSLNWSTSKAIDQLFLSLKLTIEHLLSLENSSRTRQASLNYLQIWYGFFYPDGGKILQNVIKLANDLGGQLKPPKLKWKYLPFKLIFGDRFAKNLSVFLPKTKTKVFKEYDHIMYNLQQIKKAK